MKKRDILGFVSPVFIVANACLLAACSDDDVARRSNKALVPMQVVAQQAADTRLTGTAWDEGDAIGIYTYVVGDDDETLADEKNGNVRYLVDNETNRCSAANVDSITWLAKGETYSVVAYYPFLETYNPLNISDQVPTVLVQNVSTIVGGDKPGAEQQLATPMPIYIISNWADQSDLTVLDLLWGKQEGVSADDPDVTLTLAHQFSRVQLNITIDTELSSLTADSLAGMKVLLAGKNFPAFFDLQSGEMSFGP
ncbi:MAG: fimbrillin family protein, partial [Bacteroidales bacterium]|nr:fimbrillin family protein [Bacteroidales bacterium]